ncbi:MAG: S8 family serine peptidase [Deltaproteobacteria bacterium]|jgi:hypothetical protein
MKRRQATLTVLIVSALACTTASEPTQPTESASRIRELGRPCRSDAFFVDIPVKLAIPSHWRNAGFLSALETNLEALANAPGKPWFCGSGAITCPTNAVIVEATSLLPERSTPAWRADGHLRHFRVKFREAGGDGTPLSVRHLEQCKVVATIRDEFALVAGVVAADTLLVGRECDASVAGVEGAPSDEMLSWHLTRIGLPASVTAVEPPASSTVDLGLVDSGVIPEVQASIGVASEDDLVAAPGRHVHGTALAILARQVAPEAALRSVRVLDAGGSGTSGALALGLDQLLFDTTSTQPLVINLSLGWPKQLSNSAALVGLSCQTHEDPYGEAVRYVLDVAQRIDAAGTRPIFVASSAGNLPLPPDDALFPNTDGMYGPDPDCSEPEPKLFFPAEWSRTDTCRIDVTRRERVSVAVSATDDQNHRAQISIPGTETPIVAPGQHVYAADEAAPLTSTAPVCGGASMAFPPTVTLPVALTGTSVSSVLVSAAAARAQAALMAAGGVPLKRTPLARLIYLTGRPVCRNTAEGTPVRMLDVARLDAAIANCPSLVQCAAAVPSSNESIIDKWTLAECSIEIAACSALGGTPPCTQPTSVEWPSAYMNTRAVCKLDVIDEPLKLVSSCTPNCPFNNGRDRALVGSLGPQPGSPLCPDCPALIDAQAPAAHLVLELEDTYEPETTLANPFLLISGPHPTTGHVQKFHIDLSKDTPPHIWVPGAHLELTVSLDGPQIDWGQVDAIDAALVVGVTPPGGKASTDYSPLRVGPL